MTASKLRKLLDAKEIAHEKKALKAALAAKLKDAMRKEKEGKEEEEEEEEEEDSDEEDFDEYEDDGSVEWMLRMHQKIARPKNKRETTGKFFIYDEMYCLLVVFASCN